MKSQEDSLRPKNFDWHLFERDASQKFSSLDKSYWDYLKHYTLYFSENLRNFENYRLIARQKEMVVT